MLFECKLGIWRGAVVHDGRVNACIEGEGSLLSMSCECVGGLYYKLFYNIHSVCQLTVNSVSTDVNKPLDPSTT